MEPVHSEENNLILTTLVINEGKNINNDKHCSQQNLSLDSEDYFMAKAILVSNKSKDPKTKVGACIVNKDLEIVGEGYNRMPKGCNDNLPWGKDPTNPLNDKLTYVCHAEMSAIMSKNSSNVEIENCTMYVTLFPCNECAKLIIESEIIKEIVYWSFKKGNKPKYIASQQMLTMAKIDFRQFVAETKETEEFLINLKKKN